MKRRDPQEQLQSSEPRLKYSSILMMWAAEKLVSINAFNSKLFSLIEKWYIIPNVDTLKTKTYQNMNVYGLGQVMREYVVEYCRLKQVTLLLDEWSGGKKHLCAFAICVNGIVFYYSSYSPKSGTYNINNLAKLIKNVVNDLFMKGIIVTSIASDNCNLMLSSVKNVIRDFKDRKLIHVNCSCHLIDNIMKKICKYKDESDLIEDVLHYSVM